MVATAMAGGQSVGIEITTCDGQDAQACETQGQALQPQDDGSGASTGGGSGGDGGSQPAGSDAEVHDIDLDSDSEHSTDSQGDESVTLDLDPGDEEPVDTEDEADHPEQDEPGAGADEHDQPPGTSVTPPEPVPAPVATTGGQFGLGEAFDFVSTDQALSSFAIPPFLLPIYVSAGRAYGVPWNVLASINQIETDYGRVGACAVSSAGATGWMQFMPATWRTYGVDASGDGVADPCNPVDAIYAAARYLNASGAATDLRGAIFAYNHADWYVDRVLQTAGVYGSLPSGLITETGSLAFGHFPVRGAVRYGDDLHDAEGGSGPPTGLWIYPRSGARAVATQDVTVSRILLGPGLARGLRQGRTAVVESLDRHRARGAAEDVPDPVARALDSATRAIDRVTALLAGEPLARAGGPETEASGEGAPSAERPADHGASNGDGLPPGFEAVSTPGIGVEVKDAAGNRYRYSGLHDLHDGLRPGTELRAEEALGSLRYDGGEPEGAPMLFETIGAGGAAIPPRPLVDGYRLQEAADYYSAVEPFNGNPFVPTESFATEVGSIEGTQDELARRVLAEPGIDIYECGREDIAKGIVDRRVLGALLYLRKAGLTLTVTSLRCGHGYYTAGGSISAHSYGAAVDIAAFNGQPVLGNQGPGSLTEQAIKLLMGLEGEARPAQLISLMSLGGPSFPLADHADHLHVGYTFEPSLGLGHTGDVAGSVLFGGAPATSLESHDDGEADPAHERALSERFGAIENPRVIGDSGAGVAVEGELRGDVSAADRLARRELPLQVIETATGATPVAVDVPADPRGDEAYALAIVDGSARAARGWAARQVVLLAHRDGSWSTVGPPLDSRGQVANPPLEALATAQGGRGYAVGKDGAVALLRGAQPPLVLTPKTKADLGAIDADSDGDAGVATGPAGAVLRLDGEHQDVVGVSQGSSLRDVSVLPDGSAIAAGSGAAGEPVLYEDSGGDWQPVPLDLGLAPGTAVRLTGVVTRAGETWVAGAVADEATIGSPAELPFAARRIDGEWITYCSVDPALAAVEELGQPSAQPCNGTLVADGDERGAASAVAITGDGAIIATGDSLQVVESGDDGFESVPVEMGSVESLALAPNGEGWLVGGAGRIARVQPGGPSGTDGPALLPLPGNGQPAAVAVAPGCGRALALSGGDAAVRTEEGWEQAPALGLGARDAAWQTPSVAWAIDETGALLALGDEGWNIVLDGWADSELREQLSEFTAAGPAAAPGPAAAGLQAIAFRSPVEGYAVGGDGLIQRYDSGDWSTEISPTSATLRDVAAGPGGVIAVGEQGAVLEYGDGEWSAPVEATELVGRADLTAADAMADGTMLAVGGGTVIARGADGAWRPADLPPLGQPVERLVGYRGGNGALGVVALVSGGGSRHLIAGSSAGWRPLDPPGGMAVDDFGFVAETLSVLVLGEWQGRHALGLSLIPEASGEERDGTE